MFPDDPLLSPRHANFTYRDGKLIRFQSAGDTALLERVFGAA